MSDFSVADADMQREINRGSVQGLWQALIAGESEKAAKAYASDAVVHFPQDGTFVAGRADIAARGLLQAGEAIVALNRIIGDGQVWVSECETHLHGQIMLLVSIAEVNDGLILREARYRAPIPAARRVRAARST
jgi:hypothetical protein